MDYIDESYAIQAPQAILTETSDNTCDDTVQVLNDDTAGASGLNYTVEDTSTSVSPIQTVNQHDSEASSIWTEAATTMLLDKYIEYIPQVGPFMKFKNKVAMFNQISADIFEVLKLNYSTEKCSNRYKTVQKRQNEAIKNNKKSGASRIDIPYAEQREKLNALDDSLDSEVMLGVGILKENLKRPSVGSDELESENSSGKAPRLKKVKQKQPLSEQILQSIEQNRLDRADREKEREKVRQQRHREKCDLLQQLIEISARKNI